MLSLDDCKSKGIPWPDDLQAIKAFGAWRVNSQVAADNQLLRMPLLHVGPAFTTTQHPDMEVRHYGPFDRESGNGNEHTEEDFTVFLFRGNIRTLLRSARLTNLPGHGDQQRLEATTNAIYLAANDVVRAIRLEIFDDSRKAPVALFVRGENNGQHRAFKTNYSGHFTAPPNQVSLNGLRTHPEEISALAQEVRLAASRPQAFTPPAPNRQHAIAFAPSHSAASLIHEFTSILEDRIRMSRKRPPRRS